MIAEDSEKTSEGPGYRDAALGPLYAGEFIDVGCVAVRLQRCVRRATHRPDGSTASRRARGSTNALRPVAGVRSRWCPRRAQQADESNPAAENS
jgi:hypothetical protein